MKIERLMWPVAAAAIGCTSSTGVGVGGSCNHRVKRAKFCHPSLLADGGVYGLGVQESLCSFWCCFPLRASGFCSSCSLWQTTGSYHCWLAVWLAGRLIGCCWLCWLLMATPLLLLPADPADAPPSVWHQQSLRQRRSVQLDRRVQRCSA